MIHLETDYKANYKYLLQNSKYLQNAELFNYCTKEPKFKTTWGEANVKYSEIFWKMT